MNRCDCFMDIINLLAAGYHQCFCCFSCSGMLYANTRTDPGRCRLVLIQPIPKGPRGSLITLRTRVTKCLFSWHKKSSATYKIHLIILFILWYLFLTQKSLSCRKRKPTEIRHQPEHSWHTTPVHTSLPRPCTASFSDSHCSLVELFLNHENCFWSSSSRHWFLKYKASELVLCRTNSRPCYEIYSPRSFWHKGNLFLKESAADYV